MIATNRDDSPPKLVLPRGHRYTRAGTYADARLLADLWVLSPNRRGEVLRQVEDRLIIDRPAGMMLLVALMQVLPTYRDVLIDEIQAHLAPDME